MCGIALTINGKHHEVVKMGNAIKHRGTVDSITQIDNVRVYFTLLPITDKKAPMQPYKSGKWTVWLNGFISNYRELAEKHGIEMQTNCDTELLSKFIDKFNLSNESVQELNGFFAIVAYNGKDVCAFTDRYGIKQLYLYEKGETTYISSEIKGIKAVQDLELDEFGVKDWLYSLGVMGSGTIYKGIERAKKVPFVMPKPIEIDYESAKIRLKALLEQSIFRNFKHSHNNGVFLSGGVDSGTIAKMIYPDYCFSMDYQSNEFSESQNIRLNSQAIHIAMICNQHLFEDKINQTLHVLDDLKVGSSYTNYALTELASKFCTILYSGAGSDEIFDGYVHRYNKPIDQVIKRTSFDIQIDYPEITHKEYDWKFLQGILIVEDRMAGNFAMETRYPFLDNDFVDFALSLPQEYRQNKRILKDISGLHHEVINGKKRGFSNPYVTNDEWARNALNFSLNPKQRNEVSNLLHGF